jgi:hypothetical protein
VAQGKRKCRIGRPPGKTHPEAFILRLPKGTLATWRKAAKREGLTVAELVRVGVAERIEKTGARRPRDEEPGEAAHTVPQVQP